MVEFINYGDPLSSNLIDDLITNNAQKAFEACLKSEDYEVIELRCYKDNSGRVNDIIVVDCVNDQIPSRNQYGIKVRERLALVFPSDQTKTPEVRALRNNFPTVPHLNHVPSGQPASLCLYLAPWEHIMRTWTVQKHLQSILWWLSETAKKGTAHGLDQPVERLYFNATYELLLPPDYDEKIKDSSLTLTFLKVPLGNNVCRIIRGRFFPKGKEVKKEHSTLPLNLKPIVHGVIEVHPLTLGELHDQLARRDSPFISELVALIKSKVESVLIKREPEIHCLLIVKIPIMRSESSAIESVDLRGFYIPIDLATLGHAIGALDKHESNYFVAYQIGDSNYDVGDKWRSIEIEAIDAKYEINKKWSRNASNIDSDTADFKGVIAGAGALGGSLADLWSKGAWGEWTYIDHDIVKSHNIVRHVAKDNSIGKFKVNAVKEFVDLNYHENYYTANAIPLKVSDLANNLVKDELARADLLIDSTTTLEVPRDLSQEEYVPRSASVFLTPSGISSALLLEDEARNIRLDSLEAQYYRAIISSPWGANHLVNHQGGMWVGAGCRDVSAMISYESILLHASTLATQVRLLRDQPGAIIRVWESEVKTGALMAYDIPTAETKSFICGEWRVVWDINVDQKLYKLRKEKLPNETGGIIVGYIDQKLRAIYVVDISHEPSDSTADRTGFIRGVEGLVNIRQSVTQKTANIVDYVGEWHSHPPFSSITPSKLDRILENTLAEKLAQDGSPAMMMIVGDSEIKPSVKEA